MKTDCNIIFVINYIILNINNNVVKEFLIVGLPHDKSVVNCNLGFLSVYNMTTDEFIIFTKDIITESSVWLKAKQNYLEIKLKQNLMVVLSVSSA